MRKARIIFFILPLLSLLFPLASRAAQQSVYVSPSGNNSNPGTKSQPVKEIDKAIQMAAPGAEIHIAQGVYSGTFGIGYLESDKPLKIYGSYSADFSGRDIQKTPSIFQPDNASGAKARKAMLKFTKNIDGTVIDGMVFDMGMRNAYHPKEGTASGLETGRILRSTERPTSGASTVEEPIIQIVSAAAGGNVLIQNCVFINGASFAIQAALRSGKLSILNNVFVANRMAAIEAYGTCPSKGGPKALSLCGDVEIANNTILFTWSRLKDFKDMGYGIRIMTKLRYHIHHNIIGGSVLAGVDHSRFNKDEWISLEKNIFFANKLADFQYSPASNTRLNIFADQFGDLPLASVKDNLNQVPKGLPVHKNYLQNFLDARYSESVDFKPDSSANLWREAMGMNKQGKITSKASMFMNRYPLNESFKLFGSVKDFGAGPMK